MVDNIREQIFARVKSRRVRAVLRCRSAGVLAGMEEFCEAARQMGLKVISVLNDGSEVGEGDTVAVLEGNPIEIALAEDTLVGLVAKPCGIATAARRAVELADGKLEIVCGAWKKISPMVRESLRKAASVGSVKVRISDRPFVYLDKNHVRILGGVKQALEAVQSMKGRIKVIQIRGDSKAIESETVEAVDGRADIIFVDTGRVEDVRIVLKTLMRLNARRRVKVAFAGNLSISATNMLVKEGLDILEIGREIADAPLLDFAFDVTNIW